MFESARATLYVKSEFFSSSLHKQQLLFKNCDKPGYKRKERKFLPDASYADML